MMLLTVDFNIERIAIDKATKRRSAARPMSLPYVAPTGLG